MGFRLPRFREGQRVRVCGEGIVDRVFCIYDTDGSFCYELEVYGVYEEGELEPAAPEWDEEEI
jgi:hypothetical protein